MDAFLLLDDLKDERRITIALLIIERFLFREKALEQIFDSRLRISL
jgi:hypothetical protein